VNGNSKIYIYYHHYCFSNVHRSMLKWYNIKWKYNTLFNNMGIIHVPIMMASQYIVLQNLNIKKTVKREDKIY